MPVVRPTHRRVFSVFNRAHGHLSRHVGAALADLDLKPAQAMALVYLGYHDACQLSELADGIGSNNSSTTGLVDRMEKSGLAVRKSLQSDGRGKSVHLTDKGFLLRAQVMDIMRQIDERLLSQFNEKDIEAIARFLDLARTLELR